VAVTDGTVLWCDTTGTINKLQLSPDGTLVAASTTRYASPNPTTSIYQNGSLTASVPGWIVGWLDNARLLADNYQVDLLPPHDTVYLGNFIYNAQGSTLGTLSLPEATDYEVISAFQVYSPSLNSIYSTTSSAALWMSGDASSGIGAVGSEVVFTSGTLVLVQPHF